ncbi:MAG: hypothetical protein FJ147_09385 [Deltaproteobacteria bacterium]|nr:hypothetical protein [Deltaproteobacteria bacterium]
MIDRSRSGQKVRVRTTIRTTSIDIPAGSTGRILYEFDNGVGRQLMEVLWDGSETHSPVFPSDVEIVDVTLNSSIRQEGEAR